MSVDSHDSRLSEVKVGGVRTVPVISSKYLVCFRALPIDLVAS
jgi:hypothetical protein